MFGQIEVHGPDARTFLQAQLTQELSRVTSTHSPLAAWCDPRGRVIAVMRVVELPDGTGLILPDSLVDGVLQQLGKYRLRAKVELAASPASWRAVAVDGAEDLARLADAGLNPAGGASASCRRDGVVAVRLADAGRLIEVYGESATLASTGLRFQAPLAAKRWGTARIAAGIADIDAAATARYTPHMLNLDRLGAVSFDKGCYTGQEVIARTEYRGKVKRRLQRCRTAGTVRVGDELTRDGRGVGHVVIACGEELLALLPADAAGTVLLADGTEVRPLTDNP